MEAQFIRGNQKTYIRISENLEQAQKGYEYHMCIHNDIKTLLPFQARSVNGEAYLYYEVSSMQSLDVILELKRLNRSQALKLACGIRKLCKELEAYLLDAEQILFLPKFIMQRSDTEPMKFIYMFGEPTQGKKSLETLLETCMEYLDYQDELLTEQFYGLYEKLLDQGESFQLSDSIDLLITALEEQEAEETEPPLPVKETEPAGALEGMHVSGDIPTAEIQKTMELNEESPAAIKDKKHLKAGMGILLFLDILMPFIWKPLTAAKLLLSISAGAVFGIRLIKEVLEERKRRSMEAEKRTEKEILQEYQRLREEYGIEEETTRIISNELTHNILISTHHQTPEEIVFPEQAAIVGKSRQRAQIVIEKEGISRTHARIGRKEAGCFVEDLNSRNGTFVNDQVLNPREGCILQPGDRVRFADQEYVFR